jgi:hypothetical protein
MPSGSGAGRLPEIEPSTSIFAFVKAVVDQWAALTTGGVIIAALAVWERFYRPGLSEDIRCDHDSALVAAFYLTWAGERQKNMKLSLALDTQHLEIVELKLRKYGRSTKYSLDAWITNTGPQATSTPIPVKHNPIYTLWASLGEVDSIMHQLENDAKSNTIPPSNIGNLVYPGKPHIITIAEDFLTEEQITEINNGTLAVYVFAILKYRDKAMAQNHSRSTEYCIFCRRNWLSTQHS